MLMASFLSLMKTPPVDFTEQLPDSSPLRPEPSSPLSIVKTFADNFSFSKAEFITDASNPDLSGFKEEKPSKLRRNKWQIHDINVYRVVDHTTNPTDVARAYGAKDMYRDITGADCMKFEKLLCKHECASATFIRRILTDEQDLSLTRAQLADMKKFLIVMMYRSDHRRSQYIEQRFDPFTEMSIRKHMEHNKISTIQAVWFENLKWLIDTPFDDIVKEFEEARAKGPIHALELEEFGDMMTHFIVCIWEAPAGSEFILSEGCFGSFEGAPGFRFHRFFVVSPRFAIVLVNKKYVDHRAKGGCYWVSLFGDKLHAYPETIYENGPPPKDFDPAIHSTPKDVFKFQRIVIPKEEVYKVNGILLDARLQCLTYKSSASMCKSLRYYEKVKMKMFDNRHDYSTLRRTLFSDLNRTHAVDR
ncbi:hypothetical protein BGZ97_009974 [Linnemannia gamsii]|uniref:Uncharacterized protein n=1 Tax=Linnemannia gamsii TaxID=64522 RepID=A0A9P6UPK5_9FUNG|nr:hypothetical protein BGZ97_009974 [Linnemannia gamsii]